MTAVISITAAGVVAHLPQSLDDINNPYAVKSIVFELPDTSDGGGSFEFTKTDFGLNNLLDCMVFEHTTTDDVIITANTATEYVSAVSGDTVTISFPSAEINKKRVIVVWGT